VGGIDTAAFCGTMRYICRAENAVVGKGQREEWSLHTRLRWREGEARNDDGTDSEPRLAIE
jgi:hypothetical protein